MYKVTCGPTAFFDVDCTLVMWNTPSTLGPEDQMVNIECRGYMETLFVNRYNVELLTKLAKRGHSIVVWSGGGADWAEAVVKALKLEEYVEVVTGKPTYYIDDLPNPKEWIGKHKYLDIYGNQPFKEK